MSTSSSIMVSVGPSELQKMNMVVCGSDGSVKSSISDLILGQRELRAESSSVCLRREAEVCGRLITLVELPALCSSQLSEEEVMHETLRCVSLCDPGVHAFLLVLPEGRLTDEDKGELEKIQNIFSSRFNHHTITIISTESQLEGAELDEATRTFTETCRGGYYTFGSVPDVSGLIERVQQLLMENNGDLYTPLRFLDGQVETQLRRYKNEISENKKTIQTLEKKIQTYSEGRRRDALRIVLLGRMGSGKSATGNTILGKENTFEHSLSRICQKETAEVNGRQITVIDTPGLFDTRVGNVEIQKEITKCILMAAPGPHVFLLVLKVGQRFSEEGKEVVKIIQNIFGEESMTYTMLLFIRGDLPQDMFFQYFGDHGSDIKRLIDQCGNRMHFFNNKQIRNRTQVIVLLEKIDSMLLENGGSCYTNEMFQQVEKENQERILKEIEREKEELRDRYETEIEIMKTTHQQEINDEKKRREEEFKEREHQLEEKHRLRGVQRAEEYENRRKEDEKRITEREKAIFSQLERQQVDFERQRHEDQKRRDQEEEKRREREEREEEKRREREEREEKKRREREEREDEKRREREEREEKKRREREERERREWEEKREKEREEYEVKLEELKRNREEEERKRSDLEERIKLSEEKHMKEHEELKHLQKELEIRVQEEVKSKDKLIEEHQEELDSVKKSTEEKELQMIKKMEELENRAGRKQYQKKQMEEKSGVLKKRLIEDLLKKLELPDTFKNRLTSAHFLEITPSSFYNEIPKNEKCLVHAFVQQIFNTDYRARHLSVKAKPTIPQSQQTAEKDVFAALLKKNAGNKENTPTQVHPMDVQMAVFLCADPFLQQMMVTKLSQCQYAVPLLVPNPFTEDIEFPLWTMRQISKSWKTTDTSRKVTSKTLPMCRAQTPMVAFFRIGSISSSKSQLMNRLINEKHDTFFHRDSPGSSRERLLMDGVVEIAWYLPSGKSTDHFSDCVAFCNLHGDSSINETQRKILTEMSSVNVVLLPQLEEDDNNMQIVQELFEGPTPLIVVLTDEEDDSEDAASEIGERKYKVTLMGRNQSDVSVALRSAIKTCLSEEPVTFSLEKMAEHSEMKVDEDNEDCQRGKEAAQWIIRFLETEDPSRVKERYLPCHGKLWHDWSQKNKDLRRLRSENLEMEKSQKEEELREIRRKQQSHGFSDLMELFVGSLNSLSDSEKMYFLKWTTILLDDFTSDTLSDILQEYHQKWSEVLVLKKTHNIEISQKLRAVHLNLEKISNKLNSATLGLEHMLREMGQIYEASVSERREERVEDGDFSYLPELAAELMISGHPMELMDGDAAHVPLVWVSAVLEKVIRKLGDQRVFVLSVLGIQSSGKSTMLNAMFGLQFAVSAGRCTRGAFMQLVKVSEEMKIKGELKFDYILVVYTEGLRALELAGTNTLHHDNELATFVAGLGNMTLINIFGKNPSEMQDILQIVVQAFMRMKKVRLTPSCVFVHQNVTDVAAGEKNMEGRRRLQEKLDEMTKLAAKDEGYDAECFSDIIAFDVQKDVKYFSQLWEGSPPMAPPNPHYSENVQELKRDIVSRASETNCIKLSQFQQRVKDLWEALLNENFVFSFRNTLEISVYRKLEEEYEKWTWSLRSAMLSIEDTMLNRISSGKVESVEKRELMREMSETLQKVQTAFKMYFEEDSEKETLIQWKSRFEKQIQHLHDDLVDEAKRKLNDNIKQKNIRKHLDEQLKNHENTLFEKSKELSLKLKEDGSEKRDPKSEFDSVWGKWVSELTKDVPKIKDINISNDVINILGEIYEYGLVCGQKQSAEYRKIDTVSNYYSYVSMKRKKVGPVSLWEKSLNPEDQISIRELISKVIHQTTEKVNSFPVSVLGYSSAYIQQIVRDVKELVQEFKPRDNSFEFKKEFFIDLSLYVCEQAEKRFVELHRKYREANDPLLYFEKKKTEYFKVFMNYYQGATSAAVLGDQICVKLKETILQSVYNMTAKHICDQMRGKPPFTGNRGDLEKHILKNLAEQKGDKEEKFKNFLLYMKKPRIHFENFIRDRVRQYMAAENPHAVSVIKEHIDHKQRIVISAAEKGRDEVKSAKGDVNKWLEIFDSSLVDELGDTRVHLSDDVSEDVTDYDLLIDVVKKELLVVVKELKGSLCKLSDLKKEMFREKPEEILIKHFCRCCWKQCPFCGAVCTNSQENHTGDHQAEYHRSGGMTGKSHKYSAEFDIDFCTIAVASDRSFYSSSTSSFVPYTKYRSAGGEYAEWLISADFSELVYWKWFVCEFQKNLENHYNKTFRGRGELPFQWKRFTQSDAVKSLGI